VEKSGPPPVPTPESVSDFRNLTVGGVADRQIDAQSLLRRADWYSRFRPRGAESVRQLIGAGM